MHFSSTLFSGLEALFTVRCVYKLLKIASSLLVNFFSAEPINLESVPDSNYICPSGHISQIASEFNCSKVDPYWKWRDNRIRFRYSTHIRRTFHPILRKTFRFRSKTLNICFDWLEYISFEQTAVRKYQLSLSDSRTKLIYNGDNRIRFRYSTHIRTFHPILMKTLTYLSLDLNFNILKFVNT